MIIMANTTPSSHNTYILWQLLDSAFPSGGFAHSLGLESAYQLHCLHSTATTSNSNSSAHQQLQQTIVNTIQHTATTTLPILQYAHKHVIVESEHTLDDGSIALSYRCMYDEYAAVDSLCSAALACNGVAYRASVTQGASLLAAALAVLPAHAVPVMSAMKQYVREQQQQQHAASSSRLTTHFAVMHAVLCRVLSIDETTMYNTFLWLTCRQCMSAAVRLNVIGPQAAQQLQAAISYSGVLDKILQHILHDKHSENGNSMNDDAANSDMAGAESTGTHIRSDAGIRLYSSNPLVDVLQPMHDRLYARMFTS